MARPPRPLFADAIYHVVARGNAREDIFWDDGDRDGFCELLADVVAAYGWRLLAYCLMSNHYHLLLRTPVPNLARGMRQLNGVYAQRFNRKHGRVGHVLQGRYGARLIQEDRYLRATVRYIVRNPVRARFCSEPGGWTHSSHLMTLGEATSPMLDAAGLLGYYGDTVDVARARYRAHTEEAGNDDTAGHPLAYGDETFVRRVVASVGQSRNISSRFIRPPRPPLEALLVAPDGSALARAVDHGYSLREIAAHVGCNASTVSRRVRRHRAAAEDATSGT